MKKNITVWTCDSCEKTEQVEHNVGTNYPRLWRGIYITPVGYPEYDLKDSDSKRRHICNTCWSVWMSSEGRLINPTK